MKRLAACLTIVGVVTLLLVSCSNQFGATGPDDMASSLVAGLSIPPGATLESATFSIWVSWATDRQVDVHRITGDWEEGTVTFNSLGGTYAAAIEGSFVADTVGWHSVDVTSLVAGWLNGSYANYGLLLDQEVLTYPRTVYPSRENESRHPNLQVCFTTAEGIQCETVLPIADAYITQRQPDSNFGFIDVMYTGYAADGDLEKQTLVRFDTEVTPDGGCTRTKGYWKNWSGFGPQLDMVTPLLPIWLGDEGGAKSLFVDNVAMAVAILEQDTYGVQSNGITKLYAQLLAAKLNIVNGASPDAVSDVITDADAFLADHDHTDWESLGKRTQKQVLRMKSMLDDYNNGRIGPGHCDDDEFGDDD